MNNKGNQKHLTFEQRVDIEKGLTENKSFAEMNVLMQDIQIHPVFIARRAG